MDSLSRNISLLRAFRHPLLILSILVLLLNDHILKASTPSWLTGKLSDFAGLFFFPFLLGVVIQAGVRLLQRCPAHRITSRAILLCAILCTGFFFTAIKTVPSVNASFSGLLTRLLGTPAPIALDPSDLVALVVFLPAWCLWKRLEAGTLPASPGKLAYAV